jgi:hypothetical protein
MLTLTPADIADIQSPTGTKLKSTHKKITAATNIIIKTTSGDI